MASIYVLVAQVVLWLISDGLSSCVCVTLDREFGDATDRNAQMNGHVVDPGHVLNRLVLKILRPYDKWDYLNKKKNESDKWC